MTGWGYPVRSGSLIFSNGAEPDEALHRAGHRLSLRPTGTVVLIAERAGGRMYGMAQRTSGKPIVIIGSGMAGGNAAATLREEGFPGPVVLISTEPGVPFGRPPLSKTYLRSEEDLDSWYVRPAGWYDEHDVELRSGTAVVAVDPAAHKVALDT